MQNKQSISKSNKCLCHSTNICHVWTHDCNWGILYVAFNLFYDSVHFPGDISRVRYRMSDIAPVWTLPYNNFTWENMIKLLIKRIFVSFRKFDAFLFISLNGETCVQPFITRDGNFFFYYWKIFFKVCTKNVLFQSLVSNFGAKLYYSNLLFQTLWQNCTIPISCFKLCAKIVLFQSLVSKFVPKLYYSNIFVLFLWMQLIFTSYIIDAYCLITYSILDWVFFLKLLCISCLSCCCIKR